MRAALPGWIFFCVMGVSMCRPNVVQIFRKGKLQLRVIEPIQDGEEICITYRHLDEPSFDRRRHLVAHFCFDNRPDVRCPVLYCCCCRAQKHLPLPLLDWNLHGCISERCAVHAVFSEVQCEFHILEARVSE